MKKNVLRTIIGVAFAASTVCVVYTNQKSGIILSDIITLNNIEALASSEYGCVNRANKNNGDCTTDGSTYFCENSIIFHDCVKGIYF